MNNHIDPVACRRLWTAALNREVRIACGPKDTPARQQARDWLLVESGQIAALIGMDPDWWLATVDRLAAAGWKMTIP